MLATLGILTPGSARAGDTGTTGGGQPIDTMQPSLALTVLIAKDGVASGPETGGVSAGDAIMTGEIRLFAGSIVPGGFLAADGSVIQISSAPSLYSVIGTVYGGDGVTTFGLPDLRGRAIAGVGQGPGLSPRAMGQAFGSETVTQAVSQLPAHTHTVTGAALASTGGGQPLPTIQPTIALRPLICPYGDFFYLPEIRLFAGNYSPGVWFTCQGQLLDISQYDSLYTTLGTTWGGDGQNTFALPNHQGYVALGSGAGPGLSSQTTGDSLGVEQIVMTSTQLTSHTHTVTNGATSSTGSGAAFENHQPSQVMRYMIAVNGVVPSPATTNSTATPTIGEIRPFAADSGIPSNWMFAQGQVLAITSYPSLYGVIGNTFGGDGVTTFALPDLRGRTPIGVGQGSGMTNRARGDRPGTETTTISLSQMAAHAHTIDPSNLRHPGEPQSLLVKKNAVDPSKIDLSWGAGCASGVTGYAVYQGVLGTFYAQSIFAGACDTAATSLTSQTPCAGNCYYVVSAIDDLVGEEGSLGHASSGAQIPRPASPCVPAVDLGACN